ncbi:unnamed protein product [Didymodactylos carnosus]|uniref:Uncharacterized protein n=1 Tax=Didymodactylos carnosus TaxID=1234261 RepID=A0A8S2DSA1_9BILA|nr:unnamed protein product [Didymodactylos carnosus]CAF3734974.1 unnamed protein product [Didymodactylos carnosus]
MHDPQCSRRFYDGLRKDSTVDYECEKLIPTGRDQKDSSDFDDTSKVETSHKILTRKKMPRGRKRRKQETDHKRRDRQSVEASPARKRRKQETADERRERQLKNASRERRRTEQETQDE